MDSWFWKEKRKKLHIVKDIVKHHFIHLSCHPSIHPSSHPFVLSWSIYSDGAEKEWNTDATRRRKQQEEMAHMPKPCIDGKMDEMMLHFRLVIHPSCRGLFTPTGWRKSGIHIYIVNWKLIIFLADVIKLEIK